MARQVAAYHHFYRKGLAFEPDGHIGQGGADFPIGTTVTTANLQDAFVYDTNQADDPGLLVLLNAGQPQVNENSNGIAENQSNQRCPNGGGGQRNTSAYLQAAPTLRAANNCTPLDNMVAKVLAKREIETMRATWPIRGSLSSNRSIMT